MVRNLLARGNITKEFWLERVNWSIYVLSKSLFFIQNMTLVEAWNRHKLAIDHFRIFVALLVHMSQMIKGKGLIIRVKSVFTSVNKASKAYTLYVKLKGRII